MTSFPNLERELARHRLETQQFIDALTVAINRPDNNGQEIIDLSERCETASLASIERVHLAYYEDTKAFNTLENCRLVDIPWLRDLVRNFPHKAAA